MDKKKYYITTPIYYPSGKWHLGHCYTTVCCDSIARFRRMKGEEVFFLTGTDEHGQKIEQKAKERNVTPQAYVDERVADVKKLWALLDVSYDKFIRTTDDYHVKAVQKIFKALYDKGDIYKGSYKGKYCTPCESFWTESQLVNGKCPDCGRDVIDAEEECYFFRLSKYQDRVKELLTTTDFLQPQSRVNEMVNNFINKGLDDLCVSRSTFKWGIPVTFDTKHVVYVWIDALSNYITALGYGEGGENYAKFWPADLHMVGKEIVRFHAIIWPAILMALDLPLPKKVYGHGWLLFGGDKMSKSKGNVVDPYVLSERYGIDSIRYYLLREIPFGADGNYNNEEFVTRINQDLVNDYGNLAKRTLAMSKQYFGGKAVKPAPDKRDEEFIATVDGAYAKASECIDKINVTKALESIFVAIDRANKYIDENKPWELNKNGKKERLNAVIYNLLEALRVTSTLLLPFITVSPKKVFAALGLDVPTSFDCINFGAVEEYRTGDIEVLFPRLDLKKELEELDEIARQLKEKENKMNDNATEKETVDTIEDISVDEFFRAKLKVGEVLACEKVEKADRLLKSTVKIGDEVRTIVSGIAKFYTPKELVGKKVVVVTNLIPRKIRGIESKGMLLCASEGEHGSADEKLTLIRPESDIDSGAEVC